ncbi:MAG: hypothetical protein D6677_12160 [Calditrichaeota bacterium]|nr:MAG: hypothetical protein D6677_12160 [Calditrichota bacterium]
MKEGKLGAVMFNLNNAAKLGTMVPPDFGGGHFGTARLPHGLIGPGIYMIVNLHTNNRYVGISTELEKRFGSRLSVVTELGFTTAQMDKIGVYWGTVLTQDTPSAGVVATPPLWKPARCYVSPLKGTVDGELLNLEQLLIRFTLTQIQGTISNNIYARRHYRNPTNSTITVTLEWGPGGLFQPGRHCAFWKGGEEW